MKRIIIILIGFILSIDVFATFQTPDKFSYEGKEYQTNMEDHCFPKFFMEPYFKKHPKKRPRSGLMTTALYRGYVATYEIKNLLLVLKDVGILTSADAKSSKWESVKNKVVTDGKDLVIDWFTGVIVLRYSDELIDGVKPRSRALYKETDIEAILLQIEKGKLIRVRKFAVRKYSEFKKKQFEAFKKTKEYEILVEKMLKDGTKPEHIDAFINNFLMHYTRKFLDNENVPNNEDSSVAKPE